MKRNRKKIYRLEGRRKIEEKKEGNHEDRDDRNERGKVVEERRRNLPFFPNKDGSSQ